MSVLIHLDSAYVGFIFLVVTELVIIRVVISAQLRSMDKAVKRVLDKEGAVDVDLHEYGPLKVSKSMGRFQIMALVLPPAFILALIALGEIGISGRSVPTYSTSDTVTSGGYFSVDTVHLTLATYQRAPVAFLGTWPTCVKYAENSVEASQATISYEIKDTGIEFGVVTCAEEVGVVVKYGKDLDSTSTCDDFVYSITPTEAHELVYNKSVHYDLNDGIIWDVTVHVGEVTTSSGTTSSSCSDVDGGPGKILWVSAFDEHAFNIIRYGIVDDSFRLGADSSLERWVVDSFSDRTTSSGNSIPWDSAIVVECESGCLEVIIEWILLDGGTGIENLGQFFTIWYEGLNYVDESSDPVCDQRGDFSNWNDDGFFNVGSCEGVIAEKVVLDGGQENVTLVSVWAICIVSIGCVLTLMYWFTHREAGHNLLTFEGLSKAYYEEVNPGHVWCSGGALNMKLVDCRLSAADKKQEF